MIVTYRAEKKRALRYGEKGAWTAKPTATAPQPKLGVFPRVVTSNPSASLIVTPENLFGSLVFTRDHRVSSHHALLAPLRLRLERLGVARENFFSNRQGPKFRDRKTADRDARKSSSFVCLHGGTVLRRNADKQQDLHYIVRDSSGNIYCYLGHHGLIRRPVASVAFNEISQMQ